MICLEGERNSKKKTLYNNNRGEESVFGIQFSDFIEYKRGLVKESKEQTKIRGGRVQQELYN
jgi:hypothetical protein